MSNETWEIFDLEEIKAKLSRKGVEYREFLRVPALSCGLYHLPAGSQDMQNPHDEDEVYLVLDGRARMKLGEEMRDVRPGTILYIRATESHSFFEIEEDMTLLVFFAAGR
jgi:mannose-6-phosphate isomerase-like protein (cupin superfamily)